MQLTVIVPAYNVAEYIGDTLGSVACQDPPFDEIIIVNDGSTDDTLEIIENHPCSAAATVINTENQGLGPARNTGIDQASGDYIYFLDSDDLVDRAFTKTIHARIQKTGAPDLILFSGNQFFDDATATSPLDNFSRGCDCTGLDGEQAIEQLTKTRSLYPVVGLYISKRTLWGPHALYFKPILHEDEDTLFPLTLSAQSVDILDDTLFHRRIRAGSITSSAKSRAHSDGLLAVALSMCELHQNGNTYRPRIRKIIRKRTIRHACRYMRTCHKAGTHVDFPTMLKCAWALKSFDIVLGAVGAGIKALVGKATSFL